MGPIWPQIKFFVIDNMCCLIKLAVSSFICVEGRANKLSVFCRS
jgi:hypothetical protein